MRTKIITASAIIAGLILMFFLKMLTPYVFDMVFVVTCALATMEMSKLLAKAGKYNNIYVSAVFPPIMYVGLILLIVFGHPLYQLVIYMAGAALLFTTVAFGWSMIMKKQTLREIRMRKENISLTKFSLKKTLNTFIVMVYPTLFFFFFIFINHIDVIADTAEKAALFGDNLASLLVLIFAFIIPIVTDSFAFLVGTTIRGPKLAPKISPNKTISGAVGGFLWAIIAAVIYFLIISAIPSIYAALAEAEIFIWHFIIIGGVTSVVAICGDIFESLLKRVSNVKDSGNLIPGHGGALDRIDSYIFSVVVVFMSFVFLLI